MVFMAILYTVKNSENLTIHGTYRIINVYNSLPLISQDKIK